MSAQNPNAPAHVHHAPAGPGQPVADHTLPDKPIDEVTQEDLNSPLVAPNLKGALPDNIRITPGQPPKAAPPPEEAPPGQDETKQKVVEDLKQKIGDGFLVDSTKAPEAVGEAMDLLLLQNRMDFDALLAGKPFHHEQVRPAGYALVRTVKGNEKAKVLEVDGQKLGEDLGYLERGLMLREVFLKRWQIVEANVSQGLNRVATHVENALATGQSTIVRSGSLLRDLAAALALRGDPVALGLLTRAEHQRLEEAARKDERAKMEAGGGTQEPSGTTTTVTTQSPPPPAQTPPSTPKAPSVHTKKKGQ